MKSKLFRSGFSVIIITFVFVLIAGNIFAQRGQQDVIYLKNGSIIHGKIIEIKINESITIVNNCGDTIVINHTEIERVAKKDITSKPERVKDTTSTPKSYKYFGLYSGVQISLLKGTMDDTPLPNLSIMFTSGYQFRWGLNVGAGIGIDLLEDPYMPVVLELKYVFRDTKVSPYFYINGGYTFALQNTDYEEELYYYDYSLSYYQYYNRDITTHGGYIINPGMGFKINMTNKNAFLINLGYRYMEVSETYKDWNNQEVDRTRKYNRLVLGISFQF